MKYTPAQLAIIDNKIRELAKAHYKYGSSMPLVYGKARGIRGILESHYGISLTVAYVWDVLEEMQKESE